jgi:hypothetical protein
VTTKGSSTTLASLKVLCTRNTNAINFLIVRALWPWAFHVWVRRTLRQTWRVGSQSCNQLRIGSNCSLVLLIRLVGIDSFIGSQWRC